jgi:acyl-CoA thioesterase-1
MGDSLAAGGGGGREETWPRLLARTRGVEVVDLSEVGATVATALGRVDRLPPGGGVILVEIGGNDLLGPTSATDFDRDLGELLDRVCRPGRVVLMLELPLPPFCNGFGLAQRRQAAAHGVGLVPKRVLMGVLTGEGATTDGIHLSAAGHERMAEAVWAAVRSAYGE